MSIFFVAIAPEVTILNDKKPQPGLKYGRIKRAPKLVLKKEKSSDSSSSSSDNGEDSSCGEDEGSCECKDLKGKKIWKVLTMMT